MAWRDSMLNSRAKPLKFRLVIRRSSSRVKTGGAAVVVTLPDISMPGAVVVVFNCWLCSTWNKESTVREFCNLKPVFGRKRLAFRRQVA